MEKQGWKITAIIFICLFVVSAILIGWAWSYGNELYVNEFKCNDLCYVNEECVSYIYHEYTKLCYHYNKDLIIIGTTDLS